MEKITVLLAGKHKIVTTAFAFLLDSDGRFRIVGEAADAEETLRLATLKKPKVILLSADMDLGFELMRVLKIYSPLSAFISLSVHNVITHAKKAIAAGSLGYVTMGSTKDELVKAIVEVSTGKKYICEEVKNRLVSERLMENNKHVDNSLTPQEYQIVEYIKQGLPSRRIAELMHLKPKTIQLYRCTILKKLKVKNVAALVHYVHHHPG